MIAMERNRPRQDPHRVARPLLAVVAILAVSAAAPAIVRAADLPAVETQPSEGAPPPAASPADEKLSEALEAAREELRAIEEGLTGEAAERNEAIERETKAVFDLAEKERQVREALKGLAAEEYEVDEALDAADAEAKKYRDLVDGVAGEARTQGTALRERFAGSLLALEAPDLLEALDRAVKDEKSAPPALVEALLGAYGSILRAAGEASVFQTPVLLAGGEGKVEAARILRLGLLGGYYHHVGSGEIGFLDTSETVGERPRGRTEGIAALQRERIATMTDGPGQGGWLPSDVTGGAGLATLQARDSLVTWFEKGGVWMWALLALAITAALLIIERSIVLAIRSFGLRKHIGNVLAQVERGQIEEARAYCERTGGAAGAVLSAALAHQDKDRSVMEDAVQESLLHHTPKYLARLSFISLCAAVAPLLGLLGTVTGMISTFKMVTLFGTSDPRFMAGGISEALITTEAGLRVAIPALLLRGILGALADRSIGRLEAGAMSVILALLRRRERAAATRDAKTTPGQASPNTPFYADGDWGPSRGPQLAISDDPEAAGAPS